MSSLIVSRIQNRRGLRSALPQPLNPGEFGLCTDSQQLFIGGDPTQAPFGVALYTDITNIRNIANAYITSQVIQVYTHNTFASADLTIFTATLGTAGVPANYIQWDGSQLIYVAFSAGTSAAVLTAINSYGTSSGKLDYSHTFTGISYTTPDIGINPTFDFGGFLNTATSAQGAALATLLTNLYGAAIATTRANIEVFTSVSPEYSPQDLVFYTPFIITLPNQWPTYANVPGSALEWNITETDSFIIEYSATMSNGSNYWSSVGSMQVVSSLVQTNAALTDNSTDMNNFGSSNQLQFSAVFVGPSTIQLQYRHNFGTNVLLKVHTRRWYSF